MDNSCDRCHCNPCKCPCPIPGPTGPTGPTGATGPAGTTGANGISAYGGLFNSATQLLFFPRLNEFIQISFDSTLPAKNITYPGANSLIIGESGDYEINYNVLLNTSAVVDVSISARRNGVIIQQTRGSQTLSFDTVATLSYDGRLSCSTIASLMAGDFVDLVIAVINVLPPGLDAAVNGNANATLTVKKLN